MRTFPALLCLFAMTALGRAQDFKSWNELDLTASWKKMEFLVPTYARFDSRLPNPRIVTTGINVDFCLSPHWTVTGGYLSADLLQSSQTVHVPLVAVSRRFRVRQLTFVDRNRFEKSIGYESSPVRYRNRVLLDRPFGLNEKWHVFAGDEVFLNLSAAKWNQNRFQIGGGMLLRPGLGLDSYYLLKNPNGGAPIHVAGMTLKVELRRKKRE